MSRPFLTREQVIRLIPRAVKENLVLVAIRGFNGLNRKSIFDDALFMISSHVFQSFNLNTEPSNETSRAAALISGVHYYKQGFHKKGTTEAYAALRPATDDESLPVRRFGEYNVINGYYLNIHHGSRFAGERYYGAQTIPIEQWAEFINLVYAEMERTSQRVVPYILVEY